MPTCLYCLKEKPVAEFNREHVVPEAFGKFENNFVLHEIVCTECNSYFGSTLDLKLGRQSIEGLDRYDANVKRPDEKTRFGGTPTLSARVNDGGFADGAEVYWGAAADESRLVLQLYPQFGVTDGVRTAWFKSEQLPHRNDLSSHGFSHEAEISVKSVEMDADSAHGLLAEKGYSTSKPEVAGGTREGEELDIRISGQVDRVLRRAIAKIACNYLAHQYPAVAAMPQTLALRQFIRYGTREDSNPIALSLKPLVAGATPELAPLAHGVTLEWKGGRLLGDVTLFFRFRYQVLLADGGFLIPPTMISGGHLFNVAARQILPLTGDPSRGRPLTPPKRS
jgi:HNH endonuclease